MLLVPTACKDFFFTQAKQLQQTGKPIGKRAAKRWQCCLAAGMRPDLVGTGRQSRALSEDGRCNLSAFGGSCAVCAMSSDEHFAPAIETQCNVQFEDATMSQPAMEAWMCDVDDDIPTSAAPDAGAAPDVAAAPAVPVAPAAVASDIATSLDFPMFDVDEFLLNPSVDDFEASAFAYSRW